MPDDFTDESALTPPPKPLDAEAPIALEGENLLAVPLHLSEAVHPSLIVSGQPYVLSDAKGRVLMFNGKAGDSSWNYAFLGPWESYRSYFFPVSFSANPTGGAVLSLKTTARTYTLFSNGKATSWEWAFWGDSAWNSSRPQMTLVQQGSDASFSLLWSNGGTDMYLCEGHSSWDWLYVGNTSYSSSKITFQAYTLQVKRADVVALIGRLWPTAKFGNYDIHIQDQANRVVDKAKALEIYRDSKLKDYKYKSEYFDCDDFALVYKAQSSKTAYADAVAEHLAAPYAVGYIAAVPASGAGAGHVANFFIDFQGQLWILEPQNGQIIAPSRWVNNQGIAYLPTFVIF